MTRPAAGARTMPGLTASELHWYREGFADALRWALANLALDSNDEAAVEAALDD